MQDAGVGFWELTDGRDGPQRRDEGVLVADRLRSKMPMTGRRLRLATVAVCGEQTWSGEARRWGTGARIGW
jgi:hypothetical protein